MALMAAAPGADNLGADHPELGRTPIRFVSGMAGALVNAAMRTLINGNDFGDNLIAALPSVIGATIGEAIEDRIDGTDSTAGAQSSGSQANGQQSSTPQTRRCSASGVLTVLFLSLRVPR